jgi:hypothetical protein
MYSPIKELLFLPIIEFLFFQVKNKPLILVFGLGSRS